MKTKDEVRLENLNALVSEFGSAAAVAERASTSAVYISQLRNRTRSIGNTLARRLEAACGKPNGWLDNDHSAGPKPRVASHSLKLLDQDLWVAAISDELTIVSSLATSQDAFAVRISGREMVPIFEKGDVVIVDPGSPPAPGVYVLVEDDKASHWFGRYREIRVGQEGTPSFEIVPENRDFAPVCGGSGALRILGVVVELRRIYR